MQFEDIVQRVSRGELSPEEAAELCARAGVVDGLALSIPDPDSEPPNTVAPSTPAAPRPLAERIREFTRRAILNALHKPDGVVDETLNFMELGLDSAALFELVMQIEEEIGIELYPTIFFEHQNIRALTAYFVSNHPDAFTRYLSDNHSSAPAVEPQAVLATRELPPTTVVETSPAIPPPAGEPAPAAATSTPAAAGSAASTTDIAIIGMAGKFAGSTDLHEFWKNISSGTDLLREIPADRWDYKAWFDANRDADDKIYCKWGSFIDDVDKFDAQFFNVSPREAEMMDPQLRVLMEVIYAAIEDAGYTGSIRGSNTGTFAGVCFHDYYDEMARQGSPVDPHEGTGNVPTMFANRPAFFLDLKGPSVAVDTACSSSLVALHLACNAIRNGECETAIACGSNLLLGSWHYRYFCAIGALSPTGRCHTFDESADGYVPGEGVAAVILKPLDKALRDGDTIHAVIKGSAVSHGGHTNSITAPSAASEAKVILDAWENARIDPRTISYIEAHGTGTKLGDPIEIDGLNIAFSRHTNEKHFCAVGSAKAHIGHAEGAAGLAGLLKVILAMKHRTVPAMPGFRKPNPYLKLDNSALYINRKAEAWTGVNGSPLRAGISSFGFGGTYAHVVVEEFKGETAFSALRPSGKPAREIIPISAKTEQALQLRVQQLHDFLQSGISVSLEDLACTLQTGRESMPYRLAFLASSMDDLIGTLGRIRCGQFDGVSRGFANPTVIEQVASGTPAEVLRRWVEGGDVDWKAIRAGRPGRRISLPSYPFLKQRFWREQPKVSAPRALPEPAANRAALHPLIDQNVSTIEEVRFAKSLRPEEILIDDHVVLGSRVLPGAAHLEMARAAAEFAAARPVTRIKDVFFMNPIIVSDTAEDLYVELVDREDYLEYQIVGNRNGSPVVHSTGKAYCDPDVAAPQSLDIQAIKARCGYRRTGEDIYAEDITLGLDCRAYYQGLVQTYGNATECLGLLRMPEAAEPVFSRLKMDPGLLDGIFHCPFGMIRQEGETRKLEVPYYIGEIRIHRAFEQTLYALATKSQRAGGGISFTVTDGSGAVLVEIENFISRQFTPAALGNAAEAPAHDLVFFASEWVPAPAAEVKPAQKPVIHVRNASAFAESGDEFQLDPAECAHFTQLVAALKTRGLTNVDIIYAEGAGVSAVFRLCQSLLQAGISARVVYGYRAEAGARPEHAAVAGLARSLAYETSKVDVRVVELAGAADATFLQRELHTKSESRRIRYAGSDRFEQRLKEITPEKAAVLRQNGTYLITGGAGGLGLLFARDLLSRYNANVILCGRRSPADVEAAIAQLKECGGAVLYLQADVADAAQMREVVATARRRFGALNGVLHAAGVLADGYLEQKTEEEFARVLGPKVLGASVLDEVTADEPLDFFALFSSIVAAAGNAGQTDYAAANTYLDEFAEKREQLRASGRRQGRTVSLQWPLWAEGGMHVDADAEQELFRSRGMATLSTADGIESFERMLNAGTTQVGVCSGAGDRVRRMLGLIAEEQAPEPVETETAAPAAGEQLTNLVRQELTRIAAEVLKMRQGEIRADANLSQYGFESITIAQFTRRAGEHFGVALTPAVFFEHNSIASFASFLLNDHAEQVERRYADRLNRTAAPWAPAAPVKAKKRVAPPQPAAEARISAEPVAIIGISGIFPQSEDLNAFWSNLEQARDLITEIPADRFDWRKYYGDHQMEENKTNSKWGGFMPEVDKFDAAFFSISPREAELMDPQQRLLIQTVWKTIEDAGYRPSSLSGTKTGFFVGVSSFDYTERLDYAHHEVTAYTSTGMAHSVLANRISYFFNLHGPSEPVDTACSSSLVAIHRAVNAIRNGECETAIAGGVNVLCSPKLFISFGKAGMLSPDGKCKTFDKAANGYVRGEGVGAILLKPLSRAIADGDHIYAVIRGTAVNHGGHVNSLTVPNPNAQAELLVQAWRSAQVDINTVSYIEAHGTGTSLGDPIEINGLRKAFAELGGRSRTSEQEPWCGLGSVKTNLGHLEASAGMAGIIKVLLSMKYRTLPATLHFSELNPYINLNGSPFYVVDKTQPWKALTSPSGEPLPRRAGVSSFGFGGANAHVALEEYVAPASAPESFSGPEIIILSARTTDRLKESAIQLRNHVEANDELSLHDLAYTLQVGREAMDERLAMVCTTRQELLEKLADYIEGARTGDDVFVGSVRKNAEILNVFGRDDEHHPYLDHLYSQSKLTRIAGLWALGVDVKWESLTDGTNRRRLSLPTYPFARERHWVDTDVVIDARAEVVFDPAGQALHPLVDSNESTFDRVVFKKFLSGGDAAVDDHVVLGKKILPGMAHLEMVRAAAEMAAKTPVASLDDIYWVNPIVVEDAGLNVWIEFVRRDGAVEFEVFTDLADTRHTYSFGKVTYGEASREANVDLSAIRRRCSPAKVTRKEAYDQDRSLGLHLGTYYQTLSECSGNAQEALGIVTAPPVQRFDSVALHPGMMDGVLHCALGIDGIRQQRTLRIPYYLGSVAIFDRLGEACHVHAVSEGANAFSYTITDDKGRVLACMSNFINREFTLDTQAPAKDLVFFAPEWVPAAAVAEKLTDRPVINVRHASTFAESGDEFQLDPADRGHFVQLVAALKARGLTNVDLVYAEGAGVPSVFRLCQSLLQAGISARLVYGYRADAGARPEHAAVAGLARSLAFETGKIDVRVVELVGTDVAVLARELLTQEGPRRIRYIGRERYEQRLKEITPEKTAILRQNGTYLITGGAGGLGLLFARDLLSRYNANVVLCGRRSPAEVEAAITELKECGGNVLYLQADVADAAQMREVFATARQRFGALNGVLHAAGVLADGYLEQKTEEDFARVLGPKINGAEVLDEVTAEEPLDFFALFSSIVAAVGNAGQTDYAAANAWLDEFAETREQLRASGQRHGCTVSLQWPLWADGGMRLDADTEQELFRSRGMSTLSTADGIESFERMLSAGVAQIGVCSGAGDRLRRMLGLVAEPQPVQTVSEPAASDQLTELVREELTRIAAEVLKMRQSEIRSDANLSQYGFDSISIAQFTRRVGEYFGIALTPAVFFEHNSIGSFANYLNDKHAEAVRARVDISKPEPQAPKTAAVPAPVRSARPVPVQTRAVTRSRENDPVAIIGVSGVFPNSPDLDTLWDNLAAERDLISEIPVDRFQLDDKHKGKVSSRGGFMPDVDKFDAAFFNISPREAELMDPQQRLVLQTVWKTIEDAGYRPSQLRGTNTGMFIGVASFDYSDLIDQSDKEIEAYTATGIAHSVLANRISYFFNFQGPSEPVDTACSSSLVAIHRAVNAIRNGECETAIAGGVNVLCSPKLFVSFGKAGMLSPDGRCKTFDKSANGYVRGEGVGAILLKPLSRAIADGDQIYAVIRGTAVNHGGHVNSLTVPNPNAQAALLMQAYRSAQVDIHSVSYIEAHGTGTSLGDPIEINGLRKAFAELGGTSQTPWCGLGSVKTNLGHLEAAAGMAGIIKVLLAMKHETLPATLHYRELNPYIELEGSPFYIVDKTMPWNPAGPRTAGVSSFGFAGANAHVVLQEYTDARPVAPVSDEDHLVVLSAKNGARLKTYAASLLQTLEQRGDSVRLADVAYTLATGREAMDERLAVVARTVADLAASLRSYLSGEENDRVFTGTKATGVVFGSTPEDIEYVQTLVNKRRLTRIAELWTKGTAIDLARLFEDSGARKISLPTYPFEKQRHWVPQSGAGFSLRGTSVPPDPSRAEALSRLKPAPQFTIRLSENDSILADHRVGGEAILPGVAYLEMAIATAKANGMSVSGVADVVWYQPFRTGELNVSLDPGATTFVIRSQEAVHCRGRLLTAASAPQKEAVNPTEVIARCSRTSDRADLYPRLREIGLNYGPSFQRIEQLWRNDDEALALIEPLPASDPYTMPPPVCDAILQTALAFVLDGGTGQIMVPFSVGEFTIYGRLDKPFYAWLRRRHLDLQRGSATFDIVVADEQGNILATARDFVARSYSGARLATDVQSDSTTIVVNDDELESLLNSLAAGTLSLEEAESLLD